MQLVTHTDTNTHTYVSESMCMYHATTHIHLNKFTHMHTYYTYTLKCTRTNTNVSTYIHAHYTYHAMTSSLQIANSSLLLRLVLVLAILSKKCTSVYFCIHVYTCPCMISVYIVCYEVATISRHLNITGLFCKRALWKRRYSAKETYNFKEPTNRSYPILRLLALPFLSLGHSVKTTSTSVYLCTYIHLCYGVLASLPFCQNNACECISVCICTFVYVSYMCI